MKTDLLLGQKLNSAASEREGVHIRMTAIGERRVRSGRSAAQNGKDAESRVYIQMQYKLQESISLCG